MSETEIGQRALSKVSLDALEGAIADALSEITGSRFSATISRLVLEPVPSARFSDEYEITVRVKRDNLNTRVSHPSKLEAADPEQSLREVEAARDSVAVERTVMDLTGRQLNQEWQVGARHALYHHEGRWFHQLHRFPGALFDYNGYVMFPTEDEFRECPDINITQDVHVPNGIAAMRGYIRCR